MSKPSLYETIANELKARILAGDYEAHEKLPTEKELTQQYGVSRITSKRALTELEQEGLAYRVQGRGTFVSPPASGSESSPLLEKNILFISPFPDNPEVGNYVQGILDCLQEHGCRLHIQSNGFLDLSDASSLMADYAGIILYPASSTAHASILYQLYLTGFPVVILDKHLEGVPFQAVTSDDFQGGFLAAQHLLQQGHRRLGFLASYGVEGSSSIRHRYFGFLKGIHQEEDQGSGTLLKGRGMDEAEDIFYGRCLEQIRLEHITALVMENDITAIHFMKFLRKQNCRVPQDLALVGFDNLQASSLVEPALTTIAQDFVQIGFLAAASLLELLHQSSSKDSLTVPVKLIIRESSLG